MTILGLEVPDTRTLFLIALGLHVLAGFTGVISGALAATAGKRPGRHPRAGKIYVYGMAGVFVTATVMAVMRWHHSWHLFLIACVSFGLALFGLLARTHEWRGWMAWHGAAMGLSYIGLFTGFYVDNGPRLPVWNQLPRPLHWLLPAAVGIPLIALALARNGALEPTRKASDDVNLSGS